MPRKAAEIKDLLSSAGLGYKSINPLRYESKKPHIRAAWYKKYHSVTSYNSNQLAKAKQINILSGGYDLGAFIGSSLSAPALSDKVLEQDMLMKSIGLDRTEAFQIIDTFSRGREEIDDRIRWKDRINNISTGTTVL